MLASRVMKKPVSIHADAQVRYALGKLREHGFRVMPVVDADRKLIGVFSLKSILRRLVPDYIVSGDLDDVPYAPDFGLLHKHMDEVRKKRVADLMDREMTVVRPDESLLSVAAALVAHEDRDCVLVADEDERLAGLITRGDVLDLLRSLRKDEAHAD